MIPPGDLLALDNIVLASIAFIGALFANLIRFSGDRKLPIESRLYKDWLDIACYILLFPIIGVFLVEVYLLEDTPLTPFLALHIGVTAPLTISALAGIHEATRGETIDDRNGIRVD